MLHVHTAHHVGSFGSHRTWPSASDSAMTTDDHDREAPQEPGSVPEALVGRGLIGRVDAQQKEPRDPFVEVQVLRVRSRPRPEHHVGDDPRVVDTRDHVQKQGGTGGEHDRVRGDGHGPSARTRRRGAGSGEEQQHEQRAHVNQAAREPEGPGEHRWKRPEQGRVRRGGDTRRPEGHECERQRGKRADNWQRERRHQQDGLFIVQIDAKKSQRLRSGGRALREEKTAI